MPKTKTANPEQPPLFADDHSPTLAQDAAKLWGAKGPKEAGDRGTPDMVRRACGSDVRAAAKPDAGLTPEKLAAVVATSLFALHPWELAAVARLIADFTCPRW